MIHVPAEIVSFLVDHILRANQYRAIDFIRDLCHLRLTSRSFAHSPFIKEVLFKYVTLRVSRRSCDRLKATHTSIGPYVHNLILEPSQFDSTLCQECYKSGLLGARYFYFPNVPREDEFSDSFEKYHLRAIEDEEVESEVQEVWSQAFASFRHIRRVALGNSILVCGGRDANRSDPLSFHSLPASQETPAIDSAQRRTGRRLLRLVAPLLCAPGLSIAELSLEIQGAYESATRASKFSLNSLERLYFALGTFGSEEKSSDTWNGAIEGNSAKEITHRIDLLASLLKATQSSLRELTIGHVRARYPFRWNMQIFSPDICCHQLRTLELAAFETTTTHLISALSSNFPILGRLIFSIGAKPLPESGLGDDWPAFLRLLKKVPQRKLRVEGTVTLTLDPEHTTFHDGRGFSIQLGTPYTRQYAAFRAMTCSSQKALSVVVRQYMDGIVEWNEALDMVRQYPSIPYQFGIDHDD